MIEERNQNQIIRIDARNCFVESLSDSFEIEKAHFVFAAYDLSKPAGQRQTNNIHIYMDVAELFELCRKLTGGELRWLMQNKKKSGDNTPLYQCLGGTSVEKLEKYGRPRADGKSLAPERRSWCGGNKTDFSVRGRQRSRQKPRQWAHVPGSGRTREPRFGEHDLRIPECAASHDESALRGVADGMVFEKAGGKLQRRRSSAGKTRSGWTRGGS